MSEKVEGIYPNWVIKYYFFPVFVVQRIFFRKPGYGKKSILCNISYLMD